MRSCVLTNHPDDGTTGVEIWEVTDEQAAEIRAFLGQPHAVQLLTPTQSDAADALADQVLTIHGDQHRTG